MGVRAAPKHVAGTSAALGKKHYEFAPLIASVVKGNLTIFNSFGKGCAASSHVLPTWHMYISSIFFHLPLIPFDFRCFLNNDSSVSPGLDERAAAFMQRLQNLAHEALSWPHLGERQRLVWAAALELNAVPMQELLDR